MPITINDPVWIKDAPCSSDLVDRQSVAVGNSLGIVVSINDIDGRQFADVLFPVYGGMISGLPVEDLEPFTPEAPRTKGLLSRAWAALF